MDPWWLVVRATPSTDDGAPRRHWDPPRPGIWSMLAWPPILCALLVVLGSFTFTTTRVWPDGSTWSEGAARWAGWTFLYGLAALGLLVLAAVLPRYWRPLLAGLAAVPFLAAAHLGRKNWLRLLAERDRPRDYELWIAPGLPVVTVAATVGAVLAVALALAWLWHARRGMRG